MSLLLTKQRTDVGEPPGDGRGRGHGRTDKVGPSTGALTPLEVAIAGAGGALTGLEPVGIHRQTHAAARLPPLCAGLGEDPVETFKLGLMPNLLAAGNDQGRELPGATLRPLKTRAADRRSSIRPLVHEPMKTVSTAISPIGVPGFKPMYSRALDGFLTSRRGDLRRSGTGRSHQPSCSDWCPR